MMLLTLLGLVLEGCNVMMPRRNWTIVVCLIISMDVILLDVRRESDLFFCAKCWYTVAGLNINIWVETGEWRRSLTRSSATIIACIVIRTILYGFTFIKFIILLIVLGLF